MAQAVKETQRLAALRRDKPEGARKRPGFGRVVGTLLSVLSGNARPKQDPKYVNLYREVSNASFYSQPLEYFRRPVERTNKQGDTKEYNGMWIETDRGAYTLVQIGALANEDKKFVREPVFALVYSDNPDFLARAFYGSQEERDAITPQDLEKYCEIIETRLVNEIERGHETDDAGETYYEMGWALSAIEKDAEDIKTGKKNFFRFKGSSITSGDSIQRSGSIITWREPNKKNPSAYNVYTYANPEFGKEHMRLTEYDMKHWFIRWAMRRLSVRVNPKNAPLSDERSKLLMREEFAKAAWAQKRYMHPYSQYPDERFQKPTGLKKFGIGKAKVGVNNGLQKLGHIIANFNMKQAVMSAVIGGAIAGGIGAVALLAGVASGAAGAFAAAGLLATAASWRFMAFTLGPKIIRGLTKGGMKALSPIVPLVPNKRQDVSPLIAKFSPKLRSNDDLGGWVMEHKYLKHAVIVPYEFTADTFPDVTDYTADTKKERPKQKLLNSLALQDGVNFDFAEHNGKLYVEAQGANGITTLFDTNGLVSISSQDGEPLPFSVVDGAVKELFDSVEPGQKVAFRHVANKPVHIESIAEQHKQSEENDFMIVSDISEIPDDFVTRYAKSKEQFEADLGCSLEDFDVEEFIDVDFMAPRSRKRTLRARAKEADSKERAQQRQLKADAALQRKQNALEARQHRLQMAFEQERITARINARKSNGAFGLRNQHFQTAARAGLGRAYEGTHTPSYYL